MSSLEKTLDKKTGNLTLTIHHGKKSGYAMTEELVTSLSDALAEAATDNRVHSLTLTAVGKYFCTGMNLKKADTSKVLNDDERWADATKLFEQIEYFPKPTVALLNGPSFGGGTGMALACDIRVAVDTVTLNVPEVNRGIVAAIISKYLLREIPLPIVRRSLLTTLPFTAQELHHYGTFESIHPSLKAAKKRVALLASKLAQAAPNAALMSKQLANSVAYVDEEKRRATYVHMMTSEEAKYGISQWVAKRDPDWLAYRLKAKL